MTLPAQPYLIMFNGMVLSCDPNTKALSFTKNYAGFEKTEITESANKWRGKLQGLIRFLDANVYVRVDTVKVLQAIAGEVGADGKPVTLLDCISVVPPDFPGLDSGFQNFILSGPYCEALGPEVDGPNGRVGVAFTFTCVNDKGELFQ